MRLMRSMRPMPSTSRLIVGVAAVLVTACASQPPSGESVERSAPTVRTPDADGLGDNPPADLATGAELEPRVEPIALRGANKPYEALGRSYVPLTRDVPFRERGLASWYGRKFHGRRTASGEVYDMYALTAAHPTLPIPSYARITNPANGRAVVVRVNDRGPFHPGRIVDLSYAAALRLDLVRNVAPVELERFTFEEIQSGAWRRSAEQSVAVQTPLGGVAQTTQLDAAAVVQTAAIVPIAADSADVALATGAAQATATARLPAPSARGFWLQLGAFRERAGADLLRRQAGEQNEWLAPLLAVIGDVPPYRVQAGPYASRADAEAAGQRLREALALVPIVVDRR